MFSRGLHFCVGQQLAIREMIIGFDRIIDRLDNIKLAPGATLERAGGLIFSSLKGLPITFTARKAPDA